MEATEFEGSTTVKRFNLEERGLLMQCEVCGGTPYATKDGKTVCEEHATKKRLKVPLDGLDETKVLRVYESETLSDENQELVDLVRKNLSVLTPVQRQVLQHSINGKSVTEIAREMGVSHPTISNHLKTIRTKFAKLTGFKER